MNLYIHAYISSFRMTYSRDYPDVDPSVHPAPITHRKYTGSFLANSLSLSPFIGERIDHRCAHDFSSEFFHQKKSSPRLKSYSAVWECKTRLFAGCTNGRYHHRNSFWQENSPNNWKNAIRTCNREISKNIPVYKLWAIYHRFQETKRSCILSRWVRAHF